MKTRSVIGPYVKHAQHFGIEGVMETARDAGLTLSELRELLTKLDQIDLAHQRRAKRFVSAPKRKLTVKQRVNRLCGIEDDETEGV